MVRGFAALIVLLMSLPALAADIGVLMRPTPIYIAPDTASLSTSTLPCAVGWTPPMSTLWRSAASRRHCSIAIRNSFT